MAVLAFVLLFVLLGLGALFLAMSGGPKGARQRIQTQSRRGRRGATLLFVLSILLLGIAVPAAVIATEQGRDSIPEANVKELTELQQTGRGLFSQRCKNCHALAAAKATARVGPNLDDLRPPKALVLDAIESGRAAGNGNMAAGLVQGEDAEAVAQFVAVAVGNPAQEPAE
jgi:mono/diheme cytochrome c family protein